MPSSALPGVPMATATWDAQKQTAVVQSATSPGSRDRPVACLSWRLSVCLTLIDPTRVGAVDLLDIPDDLARIVPRPARHEPAEARGGTPVELEWWLDTETRAVWIPVQAGPVWRMIRGRAEVHLGIGGEGRSGRRLSLLRAHVAPAVPAHDPRARP